MKQRVLWPLRREEAIPVLISAGLFAIAFPPFPFAAPVFLCLVPIAVSIARMADGQASARRAAVVGFWFGAVAFACTLYWLVVALLEFTWMASLGYVATFIGMGVFVGGTCALLYHARRATGLPMAILLPPVWISFEVFLNYLPQLAFPWLPLGLAVTHRPLLVQLADVSGVRGVSLFIALVNGLLADAYLLHTRRALVTRLTAVAALTVLVMGYGAWRLRSLELRDVGLISFVQPNVLQSDKWQEENRDRIVGMLSAQTRQVLAAGPTDLIVWPEVALPGYLYNHPEWQDTLRTLGRAGRTPILFGVLDAVFHTRDDYDYYNAAMLTDSLGALGAHPPYWKRNLVPVVERVPLLNPRWFGSMQYFGGFSRGHQVLFRLPFGVAGTLICYESIFPEQSREYRRGGADVLLNITNDAWFGRTVAPHQHEAHLVMRAVENRMGVVRSANTGFSGFVDPLGRIEQRTELFTPAIGTAMVRTGVALSLYTRAGDWVGLLSLGGTAALIIVVVARRRRSA